MLACLCTALWQSNYRLALDNLADPMHGCYLHAQSFTLAYGSKQDKVEIVELDGGFKVTRVGQVGDNFDWVDLFVDPGNLYCSLDIPYPPAAGPGGNMRIVGFVCPVDEHSCRVFFWRMRRVEGFGLGSGGQNTPTSAPPLRGMSPYMSPRPPKAPGYPGY